MAEAVGAIGVMDSGVGGVSVLNALREILPYENYVYLSDSLHSPYGSRSEWEIRRIVKDNIGRLIAMGCRALVVACNTATAVAVSDIRSEHPSVPVVGLEPAVRPALEYARKNGGDVLTLATEATVRSKRFYGLCQRCCEELGGCFIGFDTVKTADLPYPRVYSVPIQETVGYVERRLFESEEHIGYLRSRFLPYGERRFSAVVLGCTHFPFARRAISEALGYSVKFFDGAEGAARRLAALLGENNGAYNPQRVENGWIEWIDTDEKNDFIAKMRFFRRMGQL